MSSQSKVASIVLAAGSGTRFGNNINKVWLPLNGRRIISRSLTNAAANFKNARIIIVINPDDEDFARKALELRLSRQEQALVAQYYLSLARSLLSLINAPSTEQRMPCFARSLLTRRQMAPPAA